MSLDFLRYLAFEGDLRNLFVEDPFYWAKQSTGVSLAFDPNFMRSVAYHGASAGENNSDLTNGYARFDFSSSLEGALYWLWGDEWDIRRPQWIDSWVDHWSHLRGWEREERRKAVNIVVDVASQRDLIELGERHDYEGFPIRYRILGPIQPHLACGSGVQTGARVGTVTTLLEEQKTGDHYALISGHVGSTNGQQVYPFGAPGSLAPNLGTVVDLVVPSQTGPCNRHVAPGSQAVDAALVHLAQPVTLQLGATRTVQPISAITAGDYVEFSGVGSGKGRPGMVMSATIWKPMDIHGDGNLVCCGDLFEISHRRAPYMANSLSKPGDSGAAIVQSGPTEAWFGVLMGAERSSTFACYAEHVMDWVHKSNPHLVLTP